MSCDMAHAYNPNYSEKYQQDHKLLTHNGVAIKISAKNSYSTDSEGGAIIKEIANLANVPLQVYMIKEYKIKGIYRETRWSKWFNNRSINC